MSNSQGGAMYPKRGEFVRVVGEWRGRRYDVIGVVEREGRRVRSGAVMGAIRTPDGRVVWVPWSVQYVRFERVE
jgi:hypothetical protein